MINWGMSLELIGPAVSDSGDQIWVPQSVELRRGHRFRNDRYVPQPDFWKISDHLFPEERDNFHWCFDDPSTLSAAHDWLFAAFQVADHPATEQYQKGAWVAILRQLWAVNWASLTELSKERDLYWAKMAATRALQLHPEWLQLDYEVVLQATLEDWVVTHQTDI